MIDNYLGKLQYRQTTNVINKTFAQHCTAVCQYEWSSDGRSLLLLPCAVKTLWPLMPVSVCRTGLMFILRDYVVRESPGDLIRHGR